MDPLLLPFGFQENDPLVAELISSFLLHLLYIRTILPEPFEGFRNSLLATHAQSESIKYAERKKIKSMCDIEDAISSIRAVVAVCRVERIVILLGPSANNPKEVYSLRIYPTTSNSHNVQESVLSIKQTNQAKRHLIHKLIEHQATEECPPPAKTNVFIALKLADGIISVEAEHLLEEALRTFSFRDSFKIRTDDFVANSVVKKVFRSRRRVQPFDLTIAAQGVHIKPQAVGTVTTINTDIEGQSLLVCDAIEQQTEGPAEGRWLVLSKGIKSIQS